MIITQEDVMRNFSTIDLINILIDREYIRACAKYGVTYNSYHEASAVLLEEIEEVEFEVNDIRNLYHWFWEKVKADAMDEMGECTNKISNTTVQAILELAQVGAVVNKIKNLLKGE